MDLQLVLSAADDYARAAAKAHAESLYGTSKSYTAECFRDENEARSKLHDLLAAGSTKPASEPVAWRHNLTHSLHDLESEVQLADGDEWAEPLYTVPVEASGGVSEWRNAVKTLMETALPREYEGLDAPGHRHRVPGRWDRTGKPCNWCAAWSRLRAMLA